MFLEKGTFGVFPAKLCKGLHPFQQVILTWLWFHKNTDGICYPSVQTIANECGISKKSVKIHLNKLESLGLIKRIYRKVNEKLNKTNIYELKLGRVGATLGGGVGNTLGVGQELPPEPKPVINKGENDHAFSDASSAENADFRKFAQDGAGNLSFGG